MRLKVKINDLELFVSSINCIREKEATVFSIEYDGQSFFNQLESIEEFEIFIYYNDRVYTGFKFEPVSIEVTESGIRFFLDFKLPEYFYNQRVIDILMDWEKGVAKNFFRLPVTKKKAWLNACLVYSGLPSKPSKSIIEIDCEMIYDKYDLFYLLGESFIGPKGYFGQDFEGVRDCLFLCGKSNNSTITFKNANKLDLIFDNLHFSKKDFLNDFCQFGYSISLC